jgi:hypothetical protein
MVLSRQHALQINLGVGTKISFLFFLSLLRTGRNLSMALEAIPMALEAMDSYYVAALINKRRLSLETYFTTFWEKKVV